MIPYLLCVALLLAVCWAFYKLLLQKETFYRLNRWTGAVEQCGLDPAADPSTATQIRIVCPLRIR